MDIYNMCTHFRLAPHLAEHNYCLRRVLSNRVVTRVEMYKLKTDGFIIGYDDDDDDDDDHHHHHNHNHHYYHHHDDDDDHHHHHQ